MRSKVTLQNGLLGLLIVGVIASILLICCNIKFAPLYFRDQLQVFSQDAFDYIKPNSKRQLMMSSTQQQRRANEFLQHYFSPWTNERRFLKNDAIKQYELEKLQNFEKNPGLGANHYPLSAGWIADIDHNEDLANFPNRHLQGIVVNPTALRVLPTLDASFGSAYPFDMLQEAWLSANTPVLILHESHDGAWRLVLFGSDIGWVPSQTIAVVNKAFIQQWKTSRYVTIAVKKTPLFSEKARFITLAEFSALYPVVAEEKDNFIILAATSDAENHALVNKVRIKKEKVASFPIPLSLGQLALRVNQLMGLPYGWDGENGDYDCSSSMMALFQPFGIWLPKYSGAQAKSARWINLEGLSNKEKLAIIAQRSIPFVTLVGFPGHIMLYLNQHNGSPYLFHNTWGLRTRRFGFGQEAWALIGQSVIMPLTLDKDYLNVPKKLIDKIQTLTILTESVV